MHGSLTIEREMQTQTITKPKDYLIARDYSAVIGARWFALLVASGHERKICIWLRRRQYEPYWPRFMGVVKLNRHRKAKRWLSVIPGYLFLPVTTKANWELVKQAPGFHRVMANGDGEYIEIPEKGSEGIERIREIEIALNDSAVAAEFGIPFKRNQKVWVKTIEREGTILEIHSRRQIKIEAPMFGTVVPYFVTVDDIEALN